MSCSNSSDRRWGRNETVTFRFILHIVVNDRGRCCFDWENLFPEQKCAVSCLEKVMLTHKQ